MPSPNFPAELASIPYEEVIGTPLRAAVEANASASMTAAEFIRTVGFTEPVVGEAEPVTVDFAYERREVDPETGSERIESHTMTVPLLLLIHVPYFEVETVTIDFNVKLNSVEAYSRSSEFEFDFSNQSEGGFDLGFLDGKTKTSVNMSYQSSTRRGREVERTYDQRVHVEAGSIDPPEGVSKLFSALETTITDVTDDGDGEEE
ncbi:DUF2589 domain-containing protein [Halorubrum cibi]|uniref:DUF2589 domain-containing protein n=1 Tax=Halorubrum cibi TaxID=413815 RepID=A0A521B6H4_9EURY|nr:DUF2589 domain-containing protein [Halorubrum cibi]SMO42611.1 Protein of unknown function [Halorubrum cibi]